jgi:hypothetical protein
MSLCKLVCVAIAGCTLAAGPALGAPPESMKPSPTAPSQPAGAEHSKSHGKHHAAVAKEKKRTVHLHGKRHRSKVPAGSISK